MMKLMMTSKCTSIMAHFEGLVDVPVLCGVHRPMQQSRATLEATGHHYWTTTISLLPRRPPGQQQTKQWWKSGPTLMAILMAVAVPRYNTACIARWRRSRVLVEANGCRHWARHATNSCNWSSICRNISVFYSQLIEKGRGLMLRPQSTKGVWHIKWKRRA